MIILSAYLPVATSANALHDRSKHLTAEAQAYKDETLKLLYYYKHASAKERERVFHPYYVAYQNDEEIQIARSLIGNRSKSKAVQAMHKQYSISTLVVYDTEKRDLDNQHKLFQDVIAEFLGFNDRRVIKIYSLRLVDPTVPPHVELIVRHDEIRWHSGMLMEEAKRELALDSMYDENYLFDQFQESEGTYGCIDYMER